MTEAEPCVNRQESSFASAGKDHATTAESSAEANKRQAASFVLAFIIKFFPPAGTVRSHGDTIS